VAGLRVEVTDDRLDERDLTAQVEVVGAALYASRDQRSRVARVGADEVEDHLCPARQRPERGLVPAVDRDGRCPIRADVGEAGGQLVAVAGRCRPARPVSSARRER
jgi:hypothetical protein